MTFHTARLAGALAACALGTGGAAAAPVYSITELLPFADSRHGANYWAINSSGVAVGSSYTDGRARALRSCGPFAPQPRQRNQRSGTGRRNVKLRPDAADNGFLLGSRDRHAVDRRSAGSYVYSTANDVTNHGQATGQSEAAEGRRAFIWDEAGACGTSAPSAPAT